MLILQSLTLYEWDELLLYGFRPESLGGHVNLMHSSAYAGLLKLFCLAAPELRVALDHWVCMTNPSLALFLYLLTHGYRFESMAQLCRVSLQSAEHPLMSFQPDTAAGLDGFGPDKANNDVRDDNEVCIPIVWDLLESGPA